MRTGYPAARGASSVGLRVKAFIHLAAISEIQLLLPIRTAVALVFRV